MNKTKQMNRRGLSDVVTTVLIILFAIVAVAVVGGIVMNQINKAGKNIDKASVCTENVIEPVTCISNSTGSTVALRRTTGTVTSGAVGTVNLAFTKIDGSVGSVAETSPTTTVGQASSATYTDTAARSVQSVKATATYTVPGSSETVACESKVFDCTAA